MIHEAIVNTFIKKDVILYTKYYPLAIFWSSIPIYMIVIFIHRNTKLKILTPRSTKFFGRLILITLIAGIISIPIYAITMTSILERNGYIACPVKTYFSGPQVEKLTKDITLCDQNAS